MEHVAPLDPVDLIKQYNLSLAQTLLFQSTEMTFTTSGNWQRIFRAIKFYGLIYSAKKMGNAITVKINGPLSLFKLNRRYGVSLAKVLPEIIQSKPWTIRAQILSKTANRLLLFKMNSQKYAWLFPETTPSEKYDSLVEQDFAKRFNSLHTPWQLKREPEPLLVGNSIMLPDFALQLGKTKVFLEIVGFWTKKYLQHKIQKLSLLKTVPFILAVNENLACEKIESLPGFNIVYYKNKIPLRAILQILQGLEKREVAEQSAQFQVTIQTPIITLEQLASQTGFLPSTILQNKEKITTHVLVGKTFIEKKLLNNICQQLKEELRQPISLTQAISELRRWKIPDEISLLQSCGFRIAWKGISPNQAIVKPEEVNKNESCDSSMS